MGHQQVYFYSCPDFSAKAAMCLHFLAWAVSPSLPGCMCLIRLTNISLRSSKTMADGFGSQAPQFFRKIYGDYPIMHHFWKNLLSFSLNSYL